MHCSIGGRMNVCKKKSIAIKKITPPLWIKAQLSKSHSELRVIMMAMRAIFHTVGEGSEARNEVKCSACKYWTCVQAALSPVRWSPERYARYLVRAVERSSVANAPERGRGGHPDRISTRDKQGDTFQAEHDFYHFAISAFWFIITLSMNSNS